MNAKETTEILERLIKDHYIPAAEAIIEQKIRKAAFDAVSYHLYHRIGSGTP